MDKPRAIEDMALKCNYAGSTLSLSVEVTPPSKITIDPLLMHG